MYVLLTSLIFAGRPALAALAFVGCYLLGATAARLPAQAPAAAKAAPAPIKITVSLGDVDIRAYATEVNGYDDLAIGRIDATLFDAFRP